MGQPGRRADALLLRPLIPTPQPRVCIAVPSLDVSITQLNLRSIWFVRLHPLLRTELNIRTCWDRHR